MIIPLGLYKVLQDNLETYLDIKEDEYTITDTRDKKLLKNLQLPNLTEYKLGKKQLRDYQIQAINNVANNEWKGVPLPIGIINAATNAGKSSIGATIFKELYNKLKYQKKVMLFLVHSQEIANQFAENLKKDAKIEAGFIGSSKWKVKPVTVALIGTLASRQKAKKPEFNELVEDVVGYIADECHHNSSESYQKVCKAFTNAVIRLGLTGTINPDEIKEYKQKAVTGDVLIKITNAEMIEKGVSAKPICHIYPVNSESFIMNSRYWQKIYEKGITKNTIRNKLIADLIKSEYKQGKSILVLVNHIEHGQAIEALIKDTTGSAEFINGSDTSEIRQCAINNLAKGKLKVLIATSILDEGVDVSGINTVVYARGQKSYRVLCQSIGRGLRKKQDGSGLTFIDFLDTQHEVLLYHSQQRLKILEEEGFEVVVHG